MGEDKVAADKIAGCQEKKKGEIRVLVATPRAGFTMTEAVDNQIDMAFYLGQLEQKSDFKFYLGSIGRLFVAKAREEFADYAVKMDCDYLLMVDDDMICPMDLFEKLYRHNKDIVAPLCFQRRKPYYPVIYRTNAGWDDVRKENYFSNEMVKNYPKNTLLECDAVGFGAVLIKRWVLDKMQKPRFMSTSPTGEDILFCYRAKEEAGAKVFVDTSTQLGHLGAPKVVMEEDFEKLNNMDEIRGVYGDYDAKQHEVGK